MTSGRNRAASASSFRASRQRLDVDRVVVLGRRDADRRLAAHRPSARERLVAPPSRWWRRNIADRAERAGCGRSLAPRAPRAAPDRGLAIAHRPVDRDMAADGSSIAASFSACARVMVLSGDSFFSAIPDLRVVAGFAARPERQNDAVEDELPDEAGLLDHALVGQELAQISPHRVASVASGVPRLTSSTPILRAGAAGRSAGTGVAAERWSDGRGFVHGVSIRDRAARCDPAPVICLLSGGVRFSKAGAECPTLIRR